MSNFTRQDLEENYPTTLSSGILANDGVIESAQVTESINGDGGLTLSWKSLSGGVIPAGDTIGDYVMMEPYAPSMNDDGSFTFSPHYSDPSALLGKMLYYKDVPFVDASGNNSTEPLYTFDYYGSVNTLVTDLNTFLYDEGFSVALGSDVDGEDTMVSISVDGDNVKSVLSKIADACDVPLWYDGRTVHIGGVSNYHGDSFYNTFVVLGGTRNMAKKTPTGSYAAITRRLTIDTPGSRIGGGSPTMEKMLIFDNIYPKMELTIASVHERRCYVFDENGRKVIDHYDTVEGEQVPVYKQYSKWYITLALPSSDSEEESEEQEYRLNPNTIIEGRPLGILFQSGPLMAHEFELVMFGEDPDTEHEEDDVSSAGYTPSEGQFRIVVSADGSYLLPSTSEEGLCPSVGDKVTLTNIALDPIYTTKAKAELLAAGQEAANIYSEQTPDADSDSYYEGIDIVTGAQLGSSGGGGGMVTTSITRDLITGKVTVQYGTFSKKGLMSSMVDKVDAASVSGGGTVGGSGEEEGVGRVISSDQWKALAMAGGNLGMKSVTEKIDNEIEPNVTDLMTDMEAVKLQTDRKIELWFRPAVPLPNITSPNATANLPASEWTGHEAEHAQDLYYDNRRLVLGSTDCRVWRWEQVEITSNGQTTQKWLWNEVTDAQTISALELIADVASDGILSAGAEKSRVLIEWREAAADHADLATRVNSLNASAWQTYDAAYTALCQMLNNGSVYTSGTPEWLDDDHILTNTVIDDPDEYREAWDDYYTALAALTGEITSKKCSVFVGARNNPPSPPYNVGDMWIVSDEDNKVLYCVTGKTSSGQYDAADWQEMSAQADVRTLLIALAEEVYAAGVFGNNVTTATVQLSSNGNTVNGTAPTSGSSLAAALAGCYDALGTEDIVITLDTFPQSGNETFDIVLKPLVFNDTLIGNSVEGGLDIFMYNPSGHWELIAKSTTALIDNLGNAIRLLVFGRTTPTDTYTDERQALMQAAGLTIKQNFAQVFAQVTGEQGNVLSDAFVNVYTQGVLSGIKLKADAVQIIAGTINLSDIIKVGTSGNQSYAYIDAGDINFSGETINLNAATINLNADKINWKGSDASHPMEVIKYTDPSTQQTVVKFEVDNYGNVTMNDAIINGTVYANAGKIGGTNGWIIETNKLHSGTIGDIDSMWLATTDLTSTIGGDSHSNLRFTIGQNFGVTNNGLLIAKGGRFSGDFSAGNVDISSEGLITIEGSNGKIEMGVDAEGFPVLQYYNKVSGVFNFLYDLGPNGISRVNNRDASVQEITNGYKLLQYGTESQLIAAITTLFSKATSETSYYFLCKITAGINVQDGEYVTSQNANDVDSLNECYYKQLNSSDPKITGANKLSGWYYHPPQGAWPSNHGSGTIQVSSRLTADPDYTNYASSYPNDYKINTWPSDPSANAEKVLYVECFQFVNGRINKTLKVFMLKTKYQSDVNSNIIHTT